MTKDKKETTLSEEWHKSIAETVASAVPKLDAAQLISRIESYNFTCEAGKLENCEEWVELKKMLAE